MGNNIEILKKEIKIAGAGISGLTAATILAKTGYKVKIFERENNVGKRFNEDFQGLMNWGFEEDVLDFMKRIGIKINFWYKPVNSIDIFGPDNYLVNFKMAKPLCYLVQRGFQEKTLDQSLKKQAMENGVIICFNHLSKSTEADILATGPKFDGLTDGMVMGYTFESDSHDIFAVILDDEFAFNGYSYFFIADGHGTIATCIFGKYNKISDYLEKTLVFFNSKYSFNIKNKKKFSGTGNFFILSKQNSKKLYIGEAGGFQDFLWGFGMRYAMITASLSAESIIKNKNYEKLWKKELEGLLKRSIVNRFCFSILGRRSYKYVLKLMKKKKDLHLAFTKIYRPTLFSKIFLPIAKIYFGKNIKDINYIKY